MFWSEAGADEGLGKSFVGRMVADAVAGTLKLSMQAHASLQGEQFDPCAFLTRKEASV